MIENIKAHTDFPFIKLIDNNSLSNNTISIDRILFDYKDNRDISGHLITTNFTFELSRNRFTNNNSAIIICSKDNGNILNYSLSKIKKYGIDKKQP